MGISRFVRDRESAVPSSTSSPTGRILGVPGWTGGVSPQEPAETALTKGESVLVAPGPNRGTFGGLPRRSSLPECLTVLNPGLSSVGRGSAPAGLVSGQLRSEDQTQL